MSKSLSVFLMLASCSYSMDSHKLFQEANDNIFKILQKFTNENEKVLKCFDEYNCDKQHLNSIDKLVQQIETSKNDNNKVIKNQNKSDIKDLLEANNKIFDYILQKLKLLKDKVGIKQNDVDSDIDKLIKEADDVLKEDDMRVQNSSDQQSAGSGSRASPTVSVQERIKAIEELENSVGV